MDTRHNKGLGFGLNATNSSSSQGRTNNHLTKYLMLFTLKQRQGHLYGGRETDSLLFLKSPSPGEQRLTSELQTYKMYVQLRDYLCRVLLFNRVTEMVQQ